MAYSNQNTNKQNARELGLFAAAGETYENKYNRTAECLAVGKYQGI